MSAPAIISAWLAVEGEGGRTATDCLATLNAVVGAKYTLSRLGEWRNGKRPLPPAVRREMLRSGLVVLLKKHGFPVEQYDDASNLDALAEDLL